MTLRGTSPSKTRGSTYSGVRPATKVAQRTPGCVLPCSQSIQSTKKSSGTEYFSGSGKNPRDLRMPQCRGFERPRRCRSQHWNPGGARCLSSASVAQMLAAASIKVMDALFGLVAQNDAETYRRELLGRTWRRDWASRTFRLFVCALHGATNLDF